MPKDEAQVLTKDYIELLLHWLGLDAGRVFVVAIVEQGQAGAGVAQRVVGAAQCPLGHRVASLVFHVAL
ncbi:hypothetical protein RA876_17680 [Rhodoferax antarcticus]|nr:hypothetical protein RA876_17680 [Rhodoferax antarcticus]